MDVAELTALLAMPNLRTDLDRVESEMVRVLEQSGYSDDLVRPGLRVVTGGGKRLRPVLALAAAAISGEGTTDATVHASVAVELVQVGSLVHDDVMDHADSRRGVVTVNRKEGANWAILVGDYLLAVAGVEAAKVSADVASALAYTIADLADGQAREVAVTFDGKRSVADYLRSIGGKTAALLRCACDVGALAAGLEPAEREALRTFGTEFGLSFQIIDDVLDVVATDEQLGKPAGNDIVEGVFTLPVLIARDQDATGSIAARLSAGPMDRAAADALMADVRASGAIELALDAARQHNAAAAQALSVCADGAAARGGNSSIDVAAVVAGLAALPDRYLRWSLSRVDYPLPAER